MNDRSLSQIMDWTVTSDMGRLTTEHATQLYTLVIAQCPNTFGYSTYKKQEQLSKQLCKKKIEHGSTN
jgi:hypothetical protein